MDDNMETGELEVREPVDVPQDNQTGSAEDVSEEIPGEPSPASDDVVDTVVVEEVVAVETGSGDDETGDDDWAEQLIRHIDTAVETGIKQILDAFEHKLAYDETKQRQIDRMHEELQKYRADLVAKAARPFVRGMIQLHDDIGKLLGALREKPVEDLSPERFFKLLEGLQEDVELVLEQNNIVAYREIDNTFNPRRQRVIKRVKTAEKSISGTIAESIRPGFEQDTLILEKERVAAYQFDPTLSPIVDERKNDERGNKEEDSDKPLDKNQEKED